MKIKSFQVSKFRNVVDSGSIKVDELVTCLVGKNEAGKSGLLEALYLFNPAYEEKFNINEQYPRWLVVRDRKKGDLGEHSPISVEFRIEQEEIEAIESVFGVNPLTSNKLEVKRRYNNQTIWSFDWCEEKAVTGLRDQFPESVKKLMTNTSEFEKFNDEIKALVASNDNGISANDLNYARKIIDESGIAGVG